MIVDRLRARAHESAAADRRRICSARVTALSLAVREVYRDGPPAARVARPVRQRRSPAGTRGLTELRSPSFDAGGRRPTAESVRGDCSSRPRPARCSAKTPGTTSRSGSVTAPCWRARPTFATDVRPPQRSERDTLPHFRTTRGVARGASLLGHRRVRARRPVAGRGSRGGPHLRPALDCCSARSCSGVALGVGWWITTAALQPDRRHQCRRRAHFERQPVRARAVGDTGYRARAAGGGAQQHVRASRGGVRAPDAVHGRRRARAANAAGRAHFGGPDARSRAIGPPASIAMRSPDARHGAADAAAHRDAAGAGAARWAGRVRAARAGGPGVVRRVGVQSIWAAGDEPESHDPH